VCSLGGESTVRHGSSGVNVEHRTLERTIQSVARESIVAPYLVVVTDARYYRELSRNVFRFMPVRLTPIDLRRMHGTDERTGVHD
jgi:carboxypeptidase PM20D1